jgi:opacity protein-like surface antigen
MRSWLKRVGWIAVIPSLAGCTVLPDAFTGCNEVQPYHSAEQEGTLRVPAGADLPDTRNALKIPEVKGPELPPDPGSCLEHPPSFAAGAATTAAGDTPVAADAAEAPAIDGVQDLAMEPDLGTENVRPWTTRLGLNYQLTSDTDFDGGTTAEFKSSTGFLIGLGFALSDKLEVGANFTYDERDYDARLAGDAPGEVFPVKGDLESMGVMFNLNYYFMTGRFTPFVTTGVGWNFVDTNIPSEPPTVGCWWNPWYGYICQGFQETKNVDGLTYQAGAGLRYRLNPSLTLSGSYQRSWLDFPKADGTPTFDGIQLILDWGF